LIRICKLEEVESLADVIIPAWEIEANVPYFALVLNAKEMLKEFKMMVIRPDADVFLLINRQEIVGVLGMMIFKNPVGKENIANEHFWYVLPKHRGFGSIRLINEAKKWAREKGCSHIIFNASKMASDSHDRICNLYERLGMKLFETVYIQDIREV